MSYIKKVTEKRTKSKYRDVVVTADLDVPCHIVLWHECWSLLMSRPTSTVDTVTAVRTSLVEITRSPMNLLEDFTLPSRRTPDAFQI